MTKSLLREPHLLAHELRTPLSVLAGWYSMIRDGDISPNDKPQEWDRAMDACREAIARLNLVIAQTCDEPSLLMQLEGPQFGEVLALMEKTQDAIEQSRELMGRIEKQKQRHRELLSEVAHR
jgi:signal transduction histidine kinase